MAESRGILSLCAEIQRHLRAQAAHGELLPAILALSSSTPPRAADAPKCCEALAHALASYLNNWAALAHAPAIEAFERAAAQLPAYFRAILLLRALKMSLAPDGAAVVVARIFAAFQPQPLDEIFASLAALGDGARQIFEDLFRLVCVAPSAAASVLKRQAPARIRAEVFVPAFIAAALAKLAPVDARLLEVVMSQSCVQGFMRHALAALQAVIEAGFDVVSNMKRAVEAMALPVLLRVIDHAVHCHYYREAFRTVLGAVLSLQPSHAAVSYLSTDIWRQRSLTHHAACALIDLLVSTCADFRAEPLQTVVHCLCDMFARESFANSAHEAHHFAVCVAIRRILTNPNAKIMASSGVPLLFTGISNHLKCLIDAPRRHGMWVAEAVAPVIAVEGTDRLELLQSDERAQLQKELDEVCVHETLDVHFHMLRNDMPLSDVPKQRDSESTTTSLDGAANMEMLSKGPIGVSITDDGWGSDENESSAIGNHDSDEDEVQSYQLPSEINEKLWRSLEEGVELLLHDDANKVEQALRVAARSIRCSRQLVGEFSERLWKALQHARAKFDEEHLSVCALSAMSQIVERDPVGGGALVAKDFWSSQRSISQRLCALDVLVAACEAIRGSPSISPATEPHLPEVRASASGVIKWRSRKLEVVNSAPKSNRFGVIGRGIFYPLLYGTSKGEVVVLTKRMFDDDEMVLGKWMASMGKILLYDEVLSIIPSKSNTGTTVAAETPLTSAEWQVAVSHYVGEARHRVMCMYADAHSTYLPACYHSVRYTTLTRTVTLM